MESELDRCFRTLLIYFNIVKALKKFAKRWWVNPYE